MEKKLFLVAIKNAEDATIKLAVALPPSADWQTKHDAEKVMSTLGKDFRESHDFYVVVSADTLTAGEVLDTENVDVCFRLF